MIPWVIGGGLFFLLVLLVIAGVLRSAGWADEQMDKWR